MKAHYTIATGRSLVELTNNVNILVDTGYVPIGGPMFVPDEQRYAQALFRAADPASD